eukprot:14834916-Ditylum_brightwellii.AAC.2
MQQPNNVPDNHSFEAQSKGALDIVVLLDDYENNKALIRVDEQELELAGTGNIKAWLDAHPDWAHLGAIPIQQVIILRQWISSTFSVSDTHDTFIAIPITFPDGIVACHKIWSAIISSIDEGNSSIVLLTSSRDFKGIP